MGKQALRLDTYVSVHAKITEHLRRFLTFYKVNYLFKDNLKYCNYLAKSSPSYYFECFEVFSLKTQCFNTIHHRFHWNAEYCCKFYIHTCVNSPIKFVNLREWSRFYLVCLHKKMLSRQEKMARTFITMTKQNRYSPYSTNSVTVFSRRTFELQHSSKSTTSTSRSVSTLNTSPLLFCTPERYMCSNIFCLSMADILTFSTIQALLCYLNGTNSCHIVTT